MPSFFSKKSPPASSVDSRVKSPPETSPTVANVDTSSGQQPQHGAVGSVDAGNSATSLSVPRPLIASVLPNHRPDIMATTPVRANASQRFRPRPMGADIVIPGISTSVANPGLGPLAKARYGGVDRAPHPPTLQEQCDGMQQKLEGMLKRMGNASPPSEHLRPEPSRMRQLMSKVPLFRPKRMTEVLSFEKLDEVRTQIAGNVRSGITEYTHWDQADAYIASEHRGRDLHNDLNQAATQARNGGAAMPLQGLHERADVRALSDLMAKARLQTAAAGSAREAADQTGEMLGRLQKALGAEPGFDPGEPPGGSDVEHHVAQALAAAERAKRQSDLSPDQHKGWQTVVALADGWSVLKTASAAADRIKSHVDRELDTAERALVATMTEFPPGFSRADAVGHAALAQSTQRLAARFEDPLLRPIQSSLAQSALIQITVDALHQTVGDDPARAARLLDALMDRDPADWITQPGTLPQNPQTRRDAEQLFRTMSAVPRGIEVLAIAADHAAGNGASARTVDSVFRDMVDVRAYWSADRARAALDPADPGVDGPWLDAAKEASLALLQGTSREDVAKANQLGLGARGAIRNGFVSCAPGSAFDQCNRVMLRMVDEWVPNGTGRTGKTPFNKRTLELMDIVSRSLGINSAGVEADRATQAAVAEMRSGVDDELATARNASEAGDRIGVLVADSAMLAMLSGKGSFVSDGKLGPRVLAKKADSERETTRATPASTDGGITAVLRNHVKITTKLDTPDRARIRESINALMQNFPAEQHAEIMRAAQNRIAELTSGLASRGDRDMSGLAMLGGVGQGRSTATVDAHVERAGLHRQAVREASISSLQELRDFLAPLLVDNAADQRGDHANKLGLRDRITLQGGRQFGASAGVIALATSKLGFSPIAGLSRKSDAVFEVHHPMQGMQFAMSAKIEWRGELGGAVGPGFEAGHLGRAGVQVSGRATSARTSTAGMVLRIRRRAGDAAGMRADMVKLLDDLDQWNKTRTPADGPEEGAQDNALGDSPLMYLLAHNDKLIVADFEQQGRNIGAEVKVDASIRAMPLPHGDGVSPNLQIGPNAFLAATVDKSDHRYTEGGPTEQHGTTTSFIERASIVRKALKGGVGLSARVGVDGHSDSVTPGFRSAFPLQGEREFAQDYERVHMTALTLDGVIDADHDRYYDRPQELFSDLETHRERWILRGMETMPGDLNTEQKRALSTELLDKFVADARLLHQESTFGIYNIHYTMRPQAAPQFEMLAAREALASLRNDRAGLAKIRAERESLLRDSSTWRQSTLNLLPNSRQARTRGIKIGLEGGVTYGVNGQRQLTEFPPRFTPALKNWVTGQHTKTEIGGGALPTTKSGTRGPTASQSASTSSARQGGANAGITQRTRKIAGLPGEGWEAAQAGLERLRMARVPNSGKLGNCLIISLLQHATGDYGDAVHHESAEALRKELDTAFPGAAPPGQYLHYDGKLPDDPQNGTVVSWLVERLATGTSDDPPRRPLNVTFVNGVIAGEGGALIGARYQAYPVGGNDVVIFQPGEHFEAWTGKLGDIDELNREMEAGTFG